MTDLQTIDTTPDTYTVAEAARRMGISDDLLYKLIREDECPFRVLKLGRTLRIPKRAFDGFLNAS